MQNRTYSKVATQLGLLEHHSLENKNKNLLDIGIVARIPVPYCLLHSRPRNLVEPNVGLSPCAVGLLHSDWESVSPSPRTISSLCSATWEWWNFALPQFCQHWVYRGWSTNLTLDVSGKLRSKIWNCNCVTWWFSGKMSYINILGLGNIRPSHGLTRFLGSVPSGWLAPIDWSPGL